MTEPFVLHFCTFILATGGSAAPRFLFFPFFFVGGALSSSTASLFCNTSLFCHSGYEREE